MKSNVRATIKANGMLELEYDDDNMLSGRGFQKMDLNTLKECKCTWLGIRKGFLDFKQEDRREIKRLLDILVFT